MKQVLSESNLNALLAILENRFRENPDRHPQLDWQLVQEKLRENSDKILVLKHMEDSGGEPDVISYDEKSGRYRFVDCSIESPAGRRSLCYDEAARESRKANKPRSSAKEVAEEIGITLLDEEQYLELQALGSFDNKTSSWIETAAEMRELEGALFGDKRYGRVFFYHNGVESYYATRGFRGYIDI